MSDRRPYTPPTLTRVVLQPTQAVLSLCSVAAMGNASPADGGGLACSISDSHQLGSVVVGRSCTKTGVSLGADMMSTS